MIKYKYKFSTIERTSFKYIKILWATLDELAEEINSLKAKEIISIEPTIADETTMRNCSGIYYEYYC